jgi:hypothetical protein
MYIIPVFGPLPLRQLIYARRARRACHHGVAATLCFVTDSNTASSGGVPVCMHFLISIYWFVQDAFCGLCIPSAFAFADAMNYQQSHCTYRYWYWYWYF